MHEENPVSRAFWGRVNLKAATAFLFFSKQGKVQNLMHALKYRQQKNVGIYLGKLLGQDLLKSPLYENLDYIIPVPLHPKKLNIRGYNQSMMIAKGISEGYGTEIFHGLKRNLHSPSQTKKSRYERWENVRDIFHLVDSHLLEDKSILLIDDVITTGATLEACAKLLEDVPNIEISIASLAYASTL